MCPYSIFVNFPLFLRCLRNLCYDTILFASSTSFFVFLLLYYMLSFLLWSTSSSSEYLHGLRTAGSTVLRFQFMGSGLSPFDSRSLTPFLSEAFHISHPAFPSPLVSPLPLVISPLQGEPLLASTPVTLTPSYDCATMSSMVSSTPRYPHPPSSRGHYVAWHPPPSARLTVTPLTFFPTPPSFLSSFRLPPRAL